MRENWKNFIACSFLLVSLIGFGDSLYLAVEHFRGVSPFCSILKGCDQVTTSNYATIFGIPVALLGVLYYLTIFFLALLYVDKKQEKVFTMMVRFTIVGFLASVYFVYLQLFVIKAICLYCMGSAVSSTVLFILGIYGITRQRKGKDFFHSSS